MQTMYDGTHSVTFGPIDGSAGKNTWNDWFLIPATRPTMSIPGAQNKFVDIPGMNGSYDISDYLTSDTTYSDRNGSFDFIVDNGHAEWLTIYRDITAYLHGQKMRMTLSDDPNWYYEGRFTVDEYKSDKENSHISISYRVSPYKFSIYEEFPSDILWDTFCFERDMDWSKFNHMTIDGHATYEIETYGFKTQLGARLVSPGNEPVTVTFGGVTKRLTTVDKVVQLGYSTRSGKNTLTVSGNGIVDFGWQKTSL